MENDEEKQEKKNRATELRNTKRQTQTEERRRITDDGKTLYTEKYTEKAEKKEEEIEQLN